MSRDSAVLAALDLFRKPSLSATLQQRPVPDDVLLVIKAAAGCPETLARLRVRTGARADVLRQASAFYLQRVLLFSKAPPHRVLGAGPGTERSELRQRLRWFLFWLHPDRNRNEWQTIYARRIIAAWKIVSSEQGEPVSPARVPPRRSPRYRPTWVQHPVPRTRSRWWRAGAWLAALRLLLACILLTTIPVVGGGAWGMANATADSAPWRGGVS